jgi:hypothetical protein
MAQLDGKFMPLCSVAESDAAEADSRSICLINLDRNFFGESAV